MPPLVSRMSDFNAFGQILSSMTCRLTDNGSYVLSLYGDSDAVPLCSVGTCRGSVRFFKTLSSVESWLSRQMVSTNVPLFVVRYPILPTSELRCSGCGRFGAKFSGAAFCSKCISSLSLECDARTE